MQDRDKKELPFFESLVVDVNLLPSYLYGAFLLHSLELNAPYVNIVRNKDKSQKFLNILPKSQDKERESKTKHSGKILCTSIEKVQINNGVVAFSDCSLKDPFHFGMQNIGLRLKNVDTKENEKAKATLRPDFRVWTHTFNFQIFQKFFAEFQKVV